jgi:hypothetical protein
MRRITVGLAGVLAVVLSSLAGPANAAERPFSDQVSTVWLQPGTGPLDGLGTFVYVAPPAAAGPTQGSPLGYEYTLFFHLEDSSGGVVVLGYKDGQKVAGFGMIPSNLVSVVPYDWKYGQIYYLLTYRLSATQWGAWVYDWTSTTWSLIAVQTVPETTGRMLPESSTVVAYDDSNVPTPANPDMTCAFYPRIDALWYAPMGWRGETITNATFKEYASYDGPCPSTTQAVNGWQWSTLGQAAAA